MPQGHPDYRFICHEMWRRSRKFIRLWLKRAIHRLAEYRLGRLQSEMRTEFKKSAYEKER